MSATDALLHFAALGIPVGLMAGMGLSLVAQHDGGWGGYGSFRRRAARLGHVAAVMLPLMAGFYALVLQDFGNDPTWAGWGAWLWIAGGATLSLTLFGAAWRRALRWLLPIPATAVVAGAICLAVSLIHSLQEVS